MLLVVGCVSLRLRAGTPARPSRHGDPEEVSGSGPMERTSVARLSFQRMQYDGRGSGFAETMKHSLRGDGQRAQAAPVAPAVGRENLRVNLMSLTRWVKPVLSTQRSIK